VARNSGTPFRFKSMWDIFTRMDDHPSSLRGTATAQLGRAIGRALGPLARLAVARGLTLPSLVAILKETLVAAAEKAQRAEGLTPTQSRTSILSGVHRKDVRTILDGGGGDASLRPAPGIAETVVGRWLADPLLTNGDAPLPLPLRSPGEGPSFNDLVRAVSTDVRPRTVLDELVWLGLASEEDDIVRLNTAAFVPRAEEEKMLRFLGDNIGDHASAAVENLLAAPGPAPFPERAVFYNRLSDASLAELEAMAREEGQKLLIALNARAAQLQARDVAAGDHDGRMRFGLYFLAEPGKTESDRKRETSE
jgi:hypothetical protein